MSRFVQAKAPRGEELEPGAELPSLGDGYAARVAKYVPGEIVAAYVAILAVLLMVMLGGAWVPSFLFPAWLQQLTWLVPVRWAVDGLDAMTWRGLPFSAALVPVGLLLGFSAVCAALAVWRFRWEEA